MINIIIADDYPIIRQGLRRILTKEAGFSVVAEAGTISELRDVLSKVQGLNLLILDLSMPGGSGLEVLEEIKGSYPQLLVLILSFYPEGQLGLRAFKGGASGYLCKECAPELLVEAIQAIIKGKRYFGKVTEDLIFNELGSKPATDRPRHSLLSNRELHVFIQLGEGKTLTEIGKDLSLSVKTVSTYRQRVLQKMGKTTNAQIIGYVLRHGLLRSS